MEQTLALLQLLPCISVPTGIALLAVLRVQVSLMYDYVGVGLTFVVDVGQGDVFPRSLGLVIAVRSKLAGSHGLASLVGDLLCLQRRLVHCTRLTGVVGDVYGGDKQAIRMLMLVVAGSLHVLDC